jgi:hypothetical protein
MEAASTPAAAAAGYSVRLDIDYQEPLNRWLPLVKWLLLAPHYIVLFLLYIVASRPWLRLRRVHDHSVPALCLGLS